MAGETFIGRMLLRTGMLSEPQVAMVLEKAPETEGGIPGAAVAYAGVSEEAFLYVTSGASAYVPYTPFHYDQNKAWEDG